MHGLVSGWGAVQYEDVTSDQLKSVHLKILSPTECERQFRWSSMSHARFRRETKNQTGHTVEAVHDNMKNPAFLCAG